MIIEGLVTTQTDSGSPHVAALGPVVDPDLQSWILRPFKSTSTYQNLKQNGSCVFHVVDDVLLIAQTALHVSPQVDYRQTAAGDWLLSDACHWYKLAIQSWDERSDRAEAIATVVDNGYIRPFWGWNRAKHAVLEATILATRLHLKSPAEIFDQLQDLKSAVDKTAGPREIAAWELVNTYISQWKS